MVGGKLRTRREYWLWARIVTCVLAVRAVAGLPMLSHRRVRMSTSAAAIQTQQEYGLIFLSTPANEKWHISGAPESSQDHGRYSDRSS